MGETNKKFSRRTIALFGLIALAVLVGVLLAYEQVAVLYVLATLALVGLLIVVGSSDLEKVSRDTTGGFSGKD